MVHAMSCHTDAQYNAFVNRFRGDLAANEKAFSEYFKRHYGKSSQREQDAYVTQLANAQSDVGMRLGSDFCPRDKTLYDEVMSLENPAELPEYVAGKDSRSGVARRLRARGCANDEDSGSNTGAPGEEGRRPPLTASPPLTAYC